VVGTPAYLAPETYTRSEYSPRADIYGLGCTLFHALTGTIPYESPAMIDLLEMHVNAPVPTLASRAPALADLDPLLARCLAKQPADRFASAGEFATALAEAQKRVVKGTPAARAKPAATSTPDQTPIAAATPPRRALLLATLIVAVMALAGVLMLLLRPGPPAPAIDPTPPPDINSLRAQAMAQLDAVAQALDTGDHAGARHLLAEVVVPAGLPVISARREALAARLRALTPE